MAIPAVRWWLHPYLRHLRLPFNLLLSPIYLWGVLLGGGTLGDPRVWLGYASVHLFLYGGTTAFNSYYDRDEGPVGGMLRPPPVDEGLLRFSLLVQALGLPLALVVGGSFTLAWLMLFVVFAAYSHPAVRLKADPGRALAAIGVGQGGLGFALGWLTSAPPGALLATAPLSGIAATCLVVSGLYLVTQSYQTREDRARGDRTLPVLMGPRRALHVAVALLAPGGALMVAYLGWRFGAGWAVGVGAFFAALGAWLLSWAAGFDEEALERNYATAMGVVRLAGGGLAAVLLALLWPAGAPPA